MTNIEFGHVDCLGGPDFKEFSRQLKIQGPVLKTDVIHQDNSASFPKNILVPAVCEVVDT